MWKWRESQLVAKQLAPDSQAPREQGAQPHRVIMMALTSETTDAIGSRIAAAVRQAEPRSENSILRVKDAATSKPRRSERLGQYQNRPGVKSTQLTLPCALRGRTRKGRLSKFHRGRRRGGQCSVIRRKVERVHLSQVPINTPFSFCLPSHNRMRHFIGQSPTAAPSFAPLTLTRGVSRSPMVNALPGADRGTPFPVTDRQVHVRRESYPSVFRKRREALNFSALVASTP